MAPQNLPQLSALFLTDGGIETDLIFNEGFDLPYFAAFTLLKDETGRDALKVYFRRFGAIAAARGTGFIMESPTWRASADWGGRLAYTPNQMVDANIAAIELMRQSAPPGVQTVISGCLGPRGDGYDPGALMSIDEARRYHAHQIGALARANVDVVSAITMNNTNEAIGIARAAADAGLPSVISFTVETDGRLPTGETLQQAIEITDRDTGSAPAYYMINCAHPSHFAGVLHTDEAWLHRIGGVRANASRKSHAELDESEELDYGDPAELGEEYADLRRMLPALNVLGGCCGTDVRHIEAIAKACLTGAE